MKEDPLSLFKYLQDSLPYYILLASGYFIFLVLTVKRGIRANWKGNGEVALLTAFFHALTNSSYYRYLELPRLPLPSTSLSAGEVFVITALGLFVTLALANIAARLLVGLVTFLVLPEKSKKPAGPGQSLGQFYADDSIDDTPADPA